MAICHACGGALCDCPDLAFAGLMPTHKDGTGVFASPAIAASGRIPATISNSVASGRTLGVAGHDQRGRPGGMSDFKPLSHG